MHPRQVVWQLLQALENCHIPIWCQDQQEKSKIVLFPLGVVMIFKNLILIYILLFRLYSNI